MNCDEAKDRISVSLDGDLDALERARLDEHVKDCEACAAHLAALTASVSKLRSLTIAPLRAETVDALVAGALGPPPRQRGGWKRASAWVSHAAALLLGLVLARTIATGEPEPRVVEVPVEVAVEVPVEVPVEVLVEVPVEVIVERRVEVAVEVPVEVPVEVIRYIDRAPDLQPQLDAALGILSSLCTSGAEGLRIARVALDRGYSVPEPLDVRPLPPPAELAQGAPTRRPPARALTASATRRESVVFVRDGDRVSIRTRGAMDEVVPALIASLSDPDRALASAAEEHLSALRRQMDESFGGASDAGIPLEPEFERIEPAAAGIRQLLRDRARSRADEADAPPTRQQQWQLWWDARSGSRVAAASL